MDEGNKKRLWLEFELFNHSQGSSRGTSELPIGLGNPTCFPTGDKPSRSGGKFGLREIVVVFGYAVIALCSDGRWSTESRGPTL